MKDIRDYLHLYIGTWVTITNVSAYMIGQGFEDGKYILSGEIYHFIMSGECELQSIELRPLSDMTEEEAVDIAIIMYGKPDSVKWRMEDKGDFFRVYRKHYSESFTIDKASGDIDRYSKCDGKSELETTLQHHFITKYLLSRGFDLFGLIDSGLAIDKTKLKSP